MGKTSQITVKLKGEGSRIGDRLGGAPLVDTTSNEIGGRTRPGIVETPSFKSQSSRLSACDGVVATISATTSAPTR